jgi:hypothetical protein
MSLFSSSPKRESNMTANASANSSNNYGNLAQLVSIQSQSQKVVSYMILTRDKSRNSPIITRIPQVSNAARCIEDNRLGNVKIINKSQQFVDAVSKLLSTNSIEADILHYQMLFQVNKKESSSGGNPLLPRTIILTPSVLLLCDEDLCNEEVSVKIIDRVEVKNIWRMRQDNIDKDPLYFTITFKSTSLFAKSKKWSLKAESKQAIARLQEECKRIHTTQGTGSKSKFIVSL